MSWMIAGSPAACAAWRSATGERPAHSVARDQLVHPREALEVKLVELPRGGLVQRHQDIARVAAEDGAVRHVGEAGHGDPARAHAAREIAAGRALRRHAGRAAVRVDVHRDRVPKELGPPRRRRPRTVAAAGPLPEAEQAASAAPVEVTSAFHIHCRRVKVCAQHVMAISSSRSGLGGRENGRPGPNSCQCAGESRKLAPTRSCRR
jgi:hypothetical protein